MMEFVGKIFAVNVNLIDNSVMYVKIFADDVVFLHLILLCRVNYWIYIYSSQ